jgi:hypothetical protein
MRSRQTSLANMDGPVTYVECRSWKFEEIEYRRNLGAAPAVPADLKGVTIAVYRVSSHTSRKYSLPMNTSEHLLRKITPKPCSPACPAVELGDIDPNVIQRSSSIDVMFSDSRLAALADG